MLHKLTSVNATHATLTVANLSTAVLGSGQILSLKKICGDLKTKATTDEHPTPPV